jgi:curved DNA-binding protein CbpA
MSNPYEVLEIKRDATDDEVKKAYRELAKKYHPDNFKDNPLADLATEKMKNINEAYDAIQKERSNNSGNPQGYQGYYNNNPNYSNFPRIRELIVNKRFSEAEIMLDSVAQNTRGAEWFYLKGVLLTERGWYFDAQKNFEAAYSLDPNNNKYRDAIHQMKNRANQYYSKGGYNTRQRQNEDCCPGCSICDICTCLICADCLGCC